MRKKMILVLVIMTTILFTGCGKKTEQGAGTTTTPQPTQAAATTAPTVAATQAPTVAVVPTTGADVVTTASIVNTEEAFLKAISAKGTWIIAILQDMTINQDLLLEGEFKNGKKDDAGKDIIQRKIALYTQDENKTVTARYTLTAPKLTVTSPNARIQSGTFKGDLYIDANNFELVDATVDGNIVFMKKEYQDSFTMDETSKVTGKQSVK